MIPNEFCGLTAPAKTNVDFDGKVVSPTIVPPDVQIEGLRVASSGGDGFYVDGGGPMEWSEDIVLRNCTAYDNHPGVYPLLEAGLTWSVNAVGCAPRLPKSQWELRPLPTADTWWHMEREIYEWQNTPPTVRLPPVPGRPAPLGGRP